MLDWSGAKEDGLRVAYLLVNSARSGHTTQLSWALFPNSRVVPSTFHGQRTSTDRRPFSIFKYQMLNRTVHILLAESSTTASDKEEPHDSPNLKDKDAKCRWQNDVLAIRQYGLETLLARHIRVGARSPCELNLTTLSALLNARLELIRP